EEGGRMLALDALPQCDRLRTDVVAQGRGTEEDGCPPHFVVLGARKPRSGSSSSLSPLRHTALRTSCASVPRDSQGKLHRCSEKGAATTSPCRGSMLFPSLWTLSPNEL